MKLKIAGISLVLLAMVGCKPESAEAPPGTPAAAAKIYEVRGVVQQIAADGRKATIKHEKIPGYMAAMTMDFSIRNTNELNGIAPNDEITFKLAVTETEDWIEDVRFVAHHITEVTNGVFTFHVPTQQLKPGEMLPDYEFTSEAGKGVRLSTFRGSAVAFTFFFTACPLPEFCPRMNRNLAEARRLILAQTNAPMNWQLLSVSFDADFDKPEILGGYGSFYRGTDTNRWLFTVASTNTLAELAPKVGLNFWRDGGSISHNLRTVVLDVDGKIFQQFDGNDWTAQELADAIVAAARVK
jgi:protein SCO1/2